MKKNNSKKLILAAVLFFSGGLMLPLTNQEIVNAAQEGQEYQESELLDNEEEMTDWEQEIEAREQETEEIKEEEGNEKIKTEEEIKEEEENGEIKTEEEIKEEEENGEIKTEGEIKEEEENGEIKTEGEIKEEEGNAEIEKAEENGGTEERTQEEECINEENKDEQPDKEGEEEIYDEKKNEGEEQEENQYEKNVEEKVVEENVIEIIINESCNVTEGNSRIDTEILTEHFMQSDELPENLTVHQIILSPENANQSSEVVTEQIIETEFVMEQESQTDVQGITIMESQEIVEQAKENLSAKGEDEKEITLSIKETLNAQSEKSSPVEIVEDVKAPVVTIENLVGSSENKEVRFYYRIDDENLVEYQIKVFFTSGGKEELIWQESNNTEGELSFEKEGNYLVYLYAKDSSGNESRTYQNYSLGTFKLELEELNQFENQEVELEDMEVLLEDVFEGSNVATYQLYINGEQYKGDTSQIPEGKCILTVEMEDTHGNSGQKTMEVIATNTKTKEEVEERDKVLGEEEIQYKESKINEETEGIETDEKNEKEKKDSGIPIEAAGILGSLISGVLILFRRIKH